MTPLTEEQGVVLTGFTGIVCVKDFGTFHADVNKRLGRVVVTHELPDLSDELKELYREDFNALGGGGA